MSGSATPSRQPYAVWWNFYRTGGGRKPVKEFIESLPLAERVEVVAAMQVAQEMVAEGGLKNAARHLQGDLYEVRVRGPSQTMRIIFALEGEYGQVLLALEGFTKKTQQAPQRHIDKAQERLGNWRARGVQQQSAEGVKEAGGSSNPRGHDRAMG